MNNPSQTPSEIANPASTDTHKVENQSYALCNYNVYANDGALQEAVNRQGGAWAEKDLLRFGSECGSAERIELGFQANANKPVLHTHDRYGRRIDEVQFHPAYHQLTEIYRREGLHASPWLKPGPGAHVVRAAKALMHSAVEPGHGCPGTMTFAATPTMLVQPELAKQWLPLITNEHYDPRNIPAHEKRGITMGMAMTEKQGGSDVQANTTRAVPLAQTGAGQLYELFGHKYFVSGPMGDAFLILAQAKGGLSCFFVPRWRPDGSKNPFQIQQLKNKMGNVSNASSETELRGAMGWLIGEEGRGVHSIIKAVAVTRFDCMIGSSALMRQAISEIIHHAQQRSVFGKKLIEQPLMLGVLADLALESEAAQALTLRCAGAMDRQVDVRDEAQFIRLALAVGKYWICKRAPQMVYESMECIGGSAVMDEFIMSRLYRESPINAIWEGCGNVQALDMLRTMEKNPQSFAAYMSELQRNKGKLKVYDEYITRLENDITKTEDYEFRARQLIERMAIAIQGSLLIDSENSLVAEAFCQARMQANQYQMYGTLPKGIDCKAIIERAFPSVL